MLGIRAFSGPHTTHEVPLDKVKPLLNQFAVLVNQNADATPHDYPSIKENVLLLELSNELALLQEALCSPGDFPSWVKVRLAERQSISSEVVPYSVLPMSITNTLYWRLAELLFQPENLQAMLQIIAPDIRYVCRASVNDSERVPAEIAAGRRAELNHYRNHLPLVMSRDPVTSLTEPLSDDVLGHFVFWGNCLFDVRSLCGHRLGSQANFKAYLEKKHPELVPKLYGHNASLRRLAKDVSIFQGNRFTPRDALKALIRGLRLGSVHYTGNSRSASQPAYDAIGAFRDYLAMLPADKKFALEQLSPRTRSLGALLSVSFAPSSCVETASRMIEAFIAQYSNHHELLDSYPEMNTATRSELIRSYRRRGYLKSLRSNPDIVHLASRWLTVTLERIDLRDNDTLLSLLLELPPTFYSALWQAIPEDVVLATLSILVQYIKSELFNPVQTTELARALGQSYLHFNKAYQDRVTSTLERLPKNVAQAVFKFIPLADFFQYQGPDDAWVAWRKYVLDTFELTEMMQVRLEQMVTNSEPFVTDASGNTVLHYAVLEPNLLKPVLNRMTPSAIRTMIRQKNALGESVLDRALVFGHSLPALIAYLSPEALDLILSNIRKYLRTYPHSASTLELLEAMTRTLPEEKVLACILQESHYGGSLLHFTAYTPDSFAFLLKIIPRPLLRQNLLRKTAMDETVLHSAVGATLLAPDDTTRAPGCTAKNSVSCLLAAIDTTDIDPLLLQKNNHGSTVFHYAAQNQPLLSLLMRYLSPQQVGAVAFAKNDRGQSVLALAARDRETLKVILQKAPNSWWAWAVQGGLPIRFVSYLYAMMQLIQHAVLSLRRLGQRLVPGSGQRFFNSTQPTQGDPIFHPTHKVMDADRSEDTQPAKLLTASSTLSRR